MCFVFHSEWLLDLKEGTEHMPLIAILLLFWSKGLGEKKANKKETKGQEEKLDR